MAGGRGVEAKRIDKSSEMQLRTAGRVEDVISSHAAATVATSLLRLLPVGEC